MTSFRQIGIRLAILAAMGAASLNAQVPAALKVTPNLTDNIERPLRYRPDGADFVIENGDEFFNRPLYGGNTGFRVDAGDKPEFTLYLPGRGGNLRLGFKSGSGTKWFFDANRVTTRYRPGAMLYEIRDPLLGAAGVINVEVLALASSEGLVARVEIRDPSTPVELVWAFGGINGQRGVRDGDIGTERVPISEYFQLKPEFCSNNVYEIAGSSFTAKYTPANPSAGNAPGAAPLTIVGTTPPGSVLSVADANRWESWEQLTGSVGGATPVVIGRAALRPGEPQFVALQRNSGLAYDELPARFAATQEYFRGLRERVRIDTPDPYLNAAIGALNVAVDAVWDEPQGAVMHGAIAWRQRLLGWRGPYAQDALGWHDRAKRNFTYWAGRQNQNPVPATIAPPEESTNLARAETALHTNGDMSNSHYDMNAVFIDALFRHLRWTGDLDFARQMWPVIERHLAWERRLFRRPFGPERAPLYEAYAMIWASDDLGYNGGGVTHASAYNYAHNKSAAALARKLGFDPSPYESEATAIAQAMRKYLWLPDRGWFAEYKDLLDGQQLHPSPALWTFYLTMDAGLATPSEAWHMSRYVDRDIPHIPVRGPGVPADEKFQVLSSTNWMPYSWSINNVVMGEVVHAALGYWQAGRPDEANRLLKGALLASMFMGICPGNVGSMNYLDVYRRESQRDFADGGGVLSRAVVEGLFGITPDALTGTLRISPGFPEKWDRASLHHPEVDFIFQRSGTTDRYTVEGRFPKPLAATLVLPAFREGVAGVTVDGRSAVWRRDAETVGAPRIVIDLPVAARHEITVEWQGNPATWSPPADIYDPGRPRWIPPTDWTQPRPAGEKLEPVDLTARFNDKVTQIFRNEYRSPRSPYVSLATPKQGIGAWAGHVNATADIDDRGLRAAASGTNRFLMPNGLPFATPGAAEAKNVIFTSQWDNYPKEVTVPLSGMASRAYFLMAGTTDWMQSRMTNAELVVTYADGTVQTQALVNPESWWPIDQDYFVDDFQFRIDTFQFVLPGYIPPRVDLRTGIVRLPNRAALAENGGVIPGGAATVLEMWLYREKPLRSLTVRAVANQVVVGLMAVTLER